jgi:kynurenine formamidase
MRFVDLTAPITSSPPETPDVLRTEIDFQDHEQGAQQIESLLGVPKRLLRDGEGWATETFTRFGTHNATHVDAPWHYNSKIEGQPAQTIDQLPLDWFFSDGVVLDMTAKADGEAVDVADVEAELRRAGHELKELDIVLVHTGRDASYGEPGYMALGPGVTVAATRWLYERGVRVMGIDAWGWDPPLHLQAELAPVRDAGRDHARCDVGGVRLAHDPALREVEQEEPGPAADLQHALEAPPVRHRLAKAPQRVLDAALVEADRPLLVVGARLPVVVDGLLLLDLHVSAA